MKYALEVCNVNF